MPLLAVRGNGPAGAYGFGAASGKPAAMTAIASTTVSGQVSEIIFSSIPTTYDDLFLTLYDSGDSLYSSIATIQFNGVTSGTSYSRIQMYGDGSTTGGIYSASQSSLNAGFMQNQPNAITTHILNYANTSNFKTIVGFSASDKNAAGGQVEINAGTYSSTSAITQVRVAINATRGFETGTVCALYGIKKAV